MPDAYKDLKKTLESYSKAGQAYQGVSNFQAARQAAVDFALEENDQTAAQILSNPDTPIETAAQAVNLGLQRKKQKLEDIVENKFDEILNSKEIDRDRLEASLISYEPKENLPGNYKKLAEYHDIVRNLSIYQNKERADPKEVNQALGNMIRSVVEYYNEQYEPKAGDSEEIKAQKEIIKNFFLSLYFREGKPVRDGENIATKYLEINQDKLKKFNEKLKNKKDLVNYVKATLPKDKETRLGYLGRLAA